MAAGGFTVARAIAYPVCRDLRAADVSLLSAEMTAPKIAVLRASRNTFVLRIESILVQVLKQKFHFDLQYVACFSTS